MKKFSFLMLAVLFSASAFGQNPAKKYATLFHFTNSNCSVCANKNPPFFTTINSAANSLNVHHLAIHPSFPYSSCVFYQANTAENEGLATKFSIFGTPTLLLNGVKTSGGSLLTQAKLDMAVAETSPIKIKVVETPLTVANQMQVDVTIQTVDAAVPTGSYKLFVVAAEKVVNQVTGNGESVHHNVLRDLLPGIDGETLTIPAVGQSVSFSYTYIIKAGWKPDQMFATAWVQETTTKAVLNSGTKFDATVLGTTYVADNQSISLYPNPATDQLTLATESSAGIIIELVDVFNLAGQKMEFVAENLGTAQVKLNIARFEKGVYLVKTRRSDGKVVIGRFVKN